MERVIVCPECQADLRSPGAVRQYWDSCYSVCQVTDIQEITDNPVLEIQEEKTWWECKTEKICAHCSEPLDDFLKTIEVHDYERY